MNGIRRPLALSSMVFFSLLFLVLFLANPSLQTEPVRPKQMPALAKWAAAHPADWLAMSALTDQSLDSALPLPQRIGLWQSSYALARYLAPLRPNPTAGFVRAGLFHWYELGPADRQTVMKTVAPLLQDPSTFASMHRPLWELTRDFKYLRRTAPRTIPALTMLRDLAIASGEFGEYRELRTALRDARLAEFRAKRATATVGELIAILPETITTEDEALVRAILEDIERRPFDVQNMGGRLEELTLYAVRHHVQPLNALEPLIDIQDKLTAPTRARLAIALGDRAAAARIEMLNVITTNEWAPYLVERAAFEQKQGEAAVAALYRQRSGSPERPNGSTWTNTCGADDLCTSVFRTHDGPIAFNLSVSQSDEIPPYVEIYVDDALIAEAEITDERSFTVNAAPGLHRTEVRLVNRFTRNGTQRRVRLS